MSDFGRLLKTSRLAQVARPLKGKSYVKTHPTHQILETRDAALARQEWGIKYALPSKVKSRYITLSELDSLERLVDFETNGGDHYRRLRFQEAGVVPKTEGSVEGNPLFFKATKGPLSLKKAQLDDVIKLPAGLPKKRVQAVLDQLKAMRPELKEELLKREPRQLQDTFQSSSKSVTDQFESYASSFLLKRVQAGNANHTDSIKRMGQKIEGTAGLSYALKGRLRNSPNGIIKKEIVPGRIIADEVASFGGFVASTNSKASQGSFGSAGKEPREIARPQVPTGASLHKDGSVRITVETPLQESGRAAYPSTQPRNAKTAGKLSRSGRLTGASGRPSNLSTPRLDDLMSLL